MSWVVPLPFPKGLTLRITGPSVERLLSRVAYGGRKGRSAERRLRQPMYEGAVRNAKWRAEHPGEEPNMCCKIPMPGLVPMTPDEIEAFNERYLDYITLGL